MGRVSAEPLPEQPTQVLPPLAAHVSRFAPENLLAAVVTVVIAGGLAVLANAGPGQLVLGVAIVQGILIVAWVFGTNMPGRIGALIIATLTAVASDAVMTAWPHSQLGPLIGVLGLALPAMFIHQLTRGVVRSRVVESLSAVAVVVVATVALSALIQLRHETDARVTSTAIAAAGAALAAGLVTDAVLTALRFEPEVPRGLGGILVSLVVGGLVGIVKQHGTSSSPPGGPSFRRCPGCDRRASRSRLLIRHLHAADLVHWRPRVSSRAGSRAAPRLGRTDCLRPLPGHPGVETRGLSRESWGQGPTRRAAHTRRPARRG
jgi:hypothetical protein